MPLGCGLMVFGLSCLDVNVPKDRRILCARHVGRTALNSATWATSKRLGLINLPERV